MANNSRNYNTKMFLTNALDYNRQEYIFAALGPVFINTGKVELHSGNSGKQFLTVDVAMNGQAWQLNNKFGTTYGDDETVWAHLTMFKSAEQGKNDVGDRFQNAMQKASEHGESSVRAVIYGKMTPHVYQKNGQNVLSGMDLTVKDFALIYNVDTSANRQNPGGNQTYTAPSGGYGNGSGSYGGNQAQNNGFQQNQSAQNGAGRSWNNGQGNGQNRQQKSNGGGQNWQYQNQRNYQAKQYQSGVAGFQVQPQYRYSAGGDLPF